MPIKRVMTGSQIPLSATLAHEIDHAAIAVTADENDVSVVFHGITVKTGDKVLLDDVSGAFGAGRVAAIMGPSGAGKTTLLNVLAGRSSGLLNVSGDVVVARAKPTDVVRKRYTGYCEQQDSLIDVLSVREMLEYTAELKCSQYVSHTVKLKRVDELLEEMGLSHIVTSKVAVISGGERKRCSIGVALVSKPPVLLLDEPTTGLDAATADNILVAVKKLAKDGSRVVAATLHAPSSRAFRLLIDDVVALDSGRVAWAAPPGEGSHGPLATYISQSLDSAYIDGDSLAEHLLYAMRDARDKGIDVAEKWKQHPVHAATLKRVQFLASTAKDNDDPDAAAARLREACPGSLAWTRDDPRRKLAVATSLPHGVFTLLRYRSLRSFGDIEYVMTRLGDKVLYGLVMMSLFWGEGRKKRDADAAMNSAGVLWFVTVLTGYGAAVYMPQLVQERPIFLRETADGCYTPATALIAKTIEECVIILPFSLFYFAMVFFSVGLQGSFLISFGLFYLTAITGLAIAQMIAAFAPDGDAANALLPTYITCNLLSSGYLLLTSDIPLGWRWYTRCNHLYYAWMALLQDNFGYDSVDLAPDEDVLDHYDVRRAPGVGRCALALVIFFLVYLALAERALDALARSRR